MAQQKLENSFGYEFVEMVKTTVSTKVKEDYVSQTCYEQLLNQFDKTITDQLPGINSLFEKLNNDLHLLEKDSHMLDEDLESLLNDTASSSVTSCLSEKLKNQQNPIDDSLNKTQKKSINHLDLQHLRLTELREKICNGRIDESTLNVGVAVLGLCKDEWKEGVIEDIQKHKDKLKYKVRFTKTKRKSLLVLNHIACCETPLLFPNGHIPTGSRIAACFRKEGIFSGVIAETADFKTNRSRYLIFYDDGYTMYCSPDSVYLVYGPHIDVWNDIPQKDTSEFVKDYLSVSERQLLSLKEGQNLKVEFDGEWHKARCNKIDCSLVEILYCSDSSTEWIYRGSRRLEPLHLKQQKRKSNEKSNKIARAHTGMRRAHIEYVDLTGDSTQTTLPNTSDKKEEMWVAPWARSRSEQKAHSNRTAPTRIPNSFTELKGGYDVASQIQSRFDQKEQSNMDKKVHSSRNSRTNRKYNNELVDDGIEIDNTVLTARKQSQPYSIHSCSFQCTAAYSNVSERKLKGCNPLTKPLLCGWSREICRVKQSFPRTSFHVMYRTPCGRACRDMADVEQYLLKCKVRNLDFDHFCFDHTVRTIIGSPSNISKVNQPHDAKYFNSDYSKGVEDVPISCINEINYDEPPKMPYTKNRVPGKDVHINTSPEFMVCCDCVDNCKNKAKCACQQLTVQATSCSHGGKIKAEAGYVYKRLFTFLPTGIYECNSRCKCNMQCKNRVVQKGLQCRLQLFKTHKKGWGIRCIDDIPQGSFVCVYTGKIETDTNANAEGLKHGDEYLAELDHIEVAENQKNDYNSDNSSGFDSQGNSSDEDDLNSDKLSRLNADSTDTDDSIDFDDNDDAILKRHLGPVTLIGGHKRKLGYAVNPLTPPPTLSRSFQQQRKATTTKRNLDKSRKASNFGSSTIQRDDDTTDTDSDTDVVFHRTPTARKSTGSRLRDLAFDDDSQSDENAVGTRRFFGSEGTYIIDAKQTGNLGRYLNHSCTPNLMVQNVFLDTHDLRFPWVAFFASNFIRAGNELTWDYNYEIGSVPDRVIHCYCGSTKCRKRLL